MGNITPAGGGTLCDDIMSRYRIPKKKKFPHKIIVYYHKCYKNNNPINSIFDLIFSC